MSYMLKMERNRYELHVEMKERNRYELHVEDEGEK